MTGLTELIVLIISFVIGMSEAAHSKEAANCVLDFVVQNKLKNAVLFTDARHPYLFRRMSSIFVKCTVVLLTMNCSNMDLLLSSASFPRNQKNMFVLYRSECQERITSNAHTMRMFDKRYTWIFVLDQKNQTEEFLLTTQLEAKLTPISRTYILTLNREMSPQATCQLEELVHSRHNFSNSLSILPQRRLIMGNANTNGENKIPLQGYHLKIGALQAKPAIYLDKSGQQAVYRGFVADIIQLLSKYLGFRYKYISQKSNRFGNIVNGTWTGLVGSVYREEVDVGGFCFALTKDRARAVEFASFVLQLHYRAVIQRPTGNTEECNFSLYGEPFSSVVWVTCGATCLAAFLCALFTLTTFSSCKIVPVDWTRQELRWSFIAGILKTGTFDPPQYRSTQTVFLIFLLFMFLISNTYMSLVTATLTVRKGPQLYNDIDDLLNDGKYGIAIMRGTADNEILKNAKSGIFQRMWTKIQADPHSFIPSNDAGFEMVQTGKYVYFTADETNASPRLSKANCTMEMLKQRYLRMTQHLIFPKRSPLSEIVSVKILLMRSSGILQKIQEEYFPKYDSTTCKSKHSSTISMQQVIGPFVMLCLGVCLAIIYLIFEIILETCRVNGCSKVTKF